MMKKRILALVMSCALFASMLPATVLADVEANAEAQTEDVADATEATEDAVSYDMLSADDDSYEIEVGTDADAIEAVDAGADAEVVEGTGASEELEATGAVDAADEEDAEDAEDEEDADEQDVTYREEADGVIVTVTAPGDALPEGAELSVERYAESSADYKDAAEAIDYEADDENGMAALDISFLLDGEEVEPTEPVQVRIDVSEILPSDADASSLEVQHLEETGSMVNPVVVANDSAATKGTIDEQKATAEFEVDSFSSFTITWAGNAAGGNTTDVTVYIYDTNGLGIYDEDEQGTYEWSSGTHTIANLVEEHVSGKISEGYTYAYATVQYLTTTTMGGGVTTIGSADDPVVSISWSGTNYTVTTSSGATTTVTSSNADEFYINLYFSTPTVSISVTGADSANHTVSLTADTEYFQDSGITYTWEITSGSEYASITGNGANATVTWNEGDAAGTDITVKVTATSASGETATATYDLEYGMQQVTYTVYYDNGRTVASGAHVAVYDENGNLVSNGETDANGQVTLWIVPGTTYSLEASYTASSGSGVQMTYTHYTYEDTSYVYVGDGTDNTTINLETSDANFYEHVDVKLSIAEEDAGYSDVLANVDYIKIYDEAGELVYQSAELVHNAGTNDYNVLFADADGNEGDNPHSIAFYDTYTIEIAYEVSYTYTDDSGVSREYTESYVATIDKNSTYMDGEYYSYNGTNAYQLYNTIYGTNYTADTFATAVANQTLEDYNEHGISLDGLTYFYVAAALCDTKDSTSQAGLDLALGVNSLRRYSSTTWNFDIQKTLKNSGADAGAFSFSLYGATVDDSTWSVNVSDDYEFTLSNGTMIMADGSTESVANMSGFFAFDYDSTMVGQTQTYYFVLVEDAGEDENITYSDAVYGIKVEVTLNSSTDMNDVTITETAYNLTESESSDEAYRTFTQGEEFDGSVDEDGYTIFPFENTYKASGSVSFGVTKTISGRNTTAKSFTFALYEADEDFNYSAETLIKDQSTTGTLTENEAQSVVFDTDIEYTKGGSYYYVIKEVTSNGNGWTCDGTEYHVTVTAANDGNGNIIPTSVTYTYVDSEGTTQSGTLTADEDGVYGISGDSTLSFVNTYEDAEADVIFGGTKSITGTNSTTASFAFGLYETGSDFVVSDDSEVHATTVIGSGDFAFAEIDYTTAGTYYYVVKETTKNGSGWTVDGTEYHITVVVADATSDEGTGTFAITVSCTDAEGNTVELTQTQDEGTGIYTITGLDFENTYDASGSLNLTATKKYTGATLTANQFNFTITETTEGVEEENLYTGTGTNDADGNITFTPAIEYGLSDVGTHTYEVAETAGNAGGVTYDSNKITVTVEVADAGDGTLTTTVTVDDSEIEATDGSYNVGTFNNIYEATGGVTLTATKTYTGATMTAGQFNFQIAETSGRYIGTGTNDADGNITFSPEITYTLDDVGTHTYRIVEVNGYAGGVTYDDSEIIVTVVVADNGDGTLSTTVTVDGEGVTAGDDGAYNVGTFENSYEATGSVTFGGEKKISGKDEETSQKFTFELYTTDSDFTVAEDAEATDTQTVTGAGSFTFETISYDSDEEGDGEGTYYYVVKETATNENGWTSDTKEYRITVVVDDAGNGTFALTVTCVDAEGQTVVLTGTDANGVYNFTGLDFTNEYEPAPTSVQFTGSKYITNSASDESTDKVFTFELYNADSSFATDGDAIQTKTTTGAGSITFDEIEYKETGTYYYVIQEKALDEAGGWTIDPTVYNVTVVVEDDGLGQLVATVTEATKGTVTGTEDVYGGFDFTNAYAAEGEVTLGVVKSISGVASTDKTFSFTLYNSDEGFATGDSIETITTDGTITNSTELNFTAIPYTKAGTYYYVITETGTAPDGWTLDSKEYQVTVTVSDNGDGTLTTSASYAYTDENGETQTENSAAFTNTYAATGELALTGTKTLVGGTLTENGFTFTMTDSTGESVGDVTMAADGKITFPTLTYDETDIGGEYTYTIAETKGSDSSVQYDDTTYTVVISVADNGDGTLNVTYTVNGTESGDITFTNYQKGSLTISKTFTGLTDDQIASLEDFTITVTNSNGDTVATLTLDDADEGSSYTWMVSDLPADTYTVTESGYSLDGYEVIAKSGEVKVTDGSDVSVNDKLVWGGEDTVEFTNAYTEVGTITISKYVVAEEDIQEAHEDTEYTVVITASEDADFQWVTVTSSLSREITPTIDGKTITFTITEDETVTISGLPAGEYTVEEQGSDAMTSEHCVPTYIVDDKETEEAPTVTVPSGSENIVSVVIENEYPIDTYIMVKKEYNKDTYPEEGFTFTIEALSCDPEAEDVTIDAKDMPMPDSKTVTITEKDEIGYFGNITYDHLGTYYYKISETSGRNKGIAYDSSVYYVKVVVSYDKGTKVESVVESYCKVDEETEDYKNLEYTESNTIVTAEFENTYSAEGGVTLTATKAYTGAELKEGLFDFTITETTAGATYTGTGTNDADGNITFTPAIEYTLDDVGTHTYVIAETAGDADGVTYDSNTINVTVVVEDNNDGTLKTTVTANGEEVTAEDGAYNVGTFENSYEATGSVTFGGEKTIKGIDSTNQTFEFALYTTGAYFWVGPNAEATDTQTVTGAGSFTFKTISYDSDMEGNGAGTYYYVVKETSTDENGWTTDTTEYHITVIVEDAGDGTFTLEVTCVDAEGETVTLTQADDGSYSFTGLDFTNEYKPAPTSVQFEGTKYITNSTSTKKKFAFELYETDSSFATTGDAIDTQTTTGADAITFDEITYDETGTYYYVIQEKALDEAEGWTIDSTVYNITVEVTDDGLGQLVATVTEVTKGTVAGTDDVYGGFDFINEYAAEGSVTLGVVKSISGVSSTEEKFEFTLYNSGESFVAGNPIETITTDGTIEYSTEVNFTAIPYKAAGTYYYVITETGTAPDGWTLDTKEYHVTVTVTDNGDGTLTTSASYACVDEEGETQTGNAAAFTNAYDATGSVSFTGTKTYAGLNPSENSFTFTVKEGNTIVSTGAADESGTITFTQIEYTLDKIGEHSYVVTEDIPAGATADNDYTFDGVKYDPTEYTVVVNVTDNKDGTLGVTYTVNGEENGSIDFTNTRTGTTDLGGTKTWVDGGKAHNNAKEVTLIVTRTSAQDDVEQTLPDTDYVVVWDGNDYSIYASYDEATGTYTKLPKYDEEGNEYIYTVTEKPVDDYDTSVDGYDITNTIEQDYIDLSGSKTWIDGNISHTNSEEVKLIVTRTSENPDDSEPVVLTEDEDYVVVWGGIFNRNSYSIYAEYTGPSNHQGLDKYDKEGYEYTYTVTEVPVEGYETTYGEEGDITNTLLTSLTVDKVWDDNNDQDGKRPTSIEVQLLADEVACGEPVELIADDWTYKWNDLPVYNSDGEEITYTVAEVSVDDYECAVGELVTNNDGSYYIKITNKYIPETIDIPVTKTWDDADNQDGKRPDSITFRIWNGNTMVDSATIKPEADGSWPTYTFEGLDKYANGEEIVYTITEDEVAGYETTIDGFDVTNTHIPETVDVTGEKTWADSDNQDGVRPESLTIELLANGEVVDTMDVTEADGWVWSFTDLPKYKDGVEITYAIAELEIEGYETTINGYDVTNEYNPEETSINVQKIWDDANDQDGARPDAITVVLTKNGKETGDTLTLNESNGWAGSFSGLAKYTDGEENEYGIAEVDVEGYKCEIEEVEGTSTINITNTHEPETVIVEGSKTWENDNDQDGMRPESLTIELLANGEVVDEMVVTAADGWVWSFTDLPKYENGTEIDYSIAELTIDDYETTVNGYDVTNSYNPGKTGVNVHKSWDDADDQDGIRPEAITVILTKNGEETDQKLTLNESNDWAGSFSDLDAYTDGVKNEYSVIEDAVDGYECTIDSVEGTSTINITNRHTPEEEPVTEQLSISKEVAGNGDTSEYEFEVTLINSDGTPLEGDIETTDGETVTFEDGKATVTVTAGEEVTLLVPSGVDCTITELTTGADTTTVYDGDGNVIVQAKGTTTEATAELGTIAESTQVRFVNSYRQYFPIDEEIVTDEDDIFDTDAWVKDESVNEYNAIEIEMTTTLPVVTAYDIENGEFTMNFHEVLDHELVLDEDNADFSVYIGRHEISTAYYRITFDEDTGDDCNFHVDVDLTALYNDGVITEDDLDGNTEITIFFFADLEGTDLNGSYKSTIWYEIYDGEEWLYTSNEDVVEVYTYEVEIFKYDTETGDGLEGATLGIYYDEDCTEPVYRYVGQGFDESEKQAYTVTSGEDGYAMFYGLAEGTYYVKETEAPAGYALSDEVLTVTLSEELNDSDHTFSGEYANTPEGVVPEPETVNVNGSKTWVGDEESDRPESITIRLSADGEEVDSVVVTAENDWTWSFEGLDKYNADDDEITYTITEDAVENYTTEVNGYDVTNTYVKDESEPETVDVSGSKTWDDNNDQDGKRPESITINLLANGEKVDTATVTESDGWAWSFTDLAKDDEDGNEITYTITEEAVADYTSTIEGYDVTNSYTPVKMSIPVTKVWVDDDDLEGLRPTSVVIELYKNGASTGRVLVLSEENNWTDSFDDLDEYNEGVKNEYTVQEQEVGDYTVEITGDADTGFTVTNTYNPAAGIEGPGPATGGTGDTGSTGGTSGTGGTGGTGGTSGTSGAKTSDADLPILPIAGCCAAIALIAGVLVIRRKRES